MCLDPNDEETCVCGSKGCFELLVSQARIFKMIDALSAEEKAEMFRIQKSCRRSSDAAVFVIG